MRCKFGRSLDQTTAELVFELALIGGTMQPMVSTGTVELVLRTMIYV